VADAIHAAKRERRTKALQVAIPGTFVQRVNDFEPALHDPLHNTAKRMPMNALSTDLYQLTMMAGYFHRNVLDTRATFELFVRRLPRNRNLLVSAGLEQALSYLERLQFTADEIAWIRGLPAFANIPTPFFDYLRSFRFSGDVWAMPEGTPFFPGEPVLRVSAPIAEAQLVETALLAIVNFQTTVASKALRIVQAAGGRSVMEFGARRAHGLEAALFAARAAYLAGCDATSFVQAARQFDIPLAGTMAHSWILAAPSEREAFTSYASLFGDHTVLLLDTVDVDRATTTMIEASLRPQGVRIDSGDLLASARAVRDRLDRAGLTSTRIIISGDLDEWKIAALVSARAPVDTFAVGTTLVTSDDAPALGGVYKLVEIEEGGTTRGVMKRSEGKTTWPGRKQVWRVSTDGRIVRDLIALSGEPAPGDATPLLQLVMRDGARTATPASLADARLHCRRMADALPQSLLALEGPAPYPVQISDALSSLIR
jgi:nicotinate phosphoribosyltransferase